MATAMITPPVTPHETAALENPALLAPDPFGRLDHRMASTAVTLAEALPGHYLAIADSGGIEWLIPVKDAITHVGRAVAADLRFDDVHVSRRHAIVIRDGRHVRVLDDRSSAGTFVNGRRVVASDLGHGDVVRLGPITFTYVRVC